MNRWSFFSARWGRPNLQSTYDGLGVVNEQQRMAAATFFPSMPDPLRTRWRVLSEICAKEREISTNIGVFVEENFERLDS